MTIGLALPVISKQFQTPIHIAYYTITSSLIGYIFGAILDSVLSDRFGRRIGLIISVTLFSIGSLLSAFSSNIHFLIIIRFVVGMGIGSEIANVTTYIGELAPVRLRGKATSIAIAFGMIGFAIVPFISLYLIPNFSWGWRVLFAVGGLGGFTTLYFRRRLDPSIRWLVLHNHLDEAASLINKVEAFAKRKIQKELPQPVINPNHRTIERRSFIYLLKPPYLSRTCLFALLWFIYYIGNYAWLTLGTELLYQKGFGISQSISFICISSLGFVFGSFIAPVLSDRIERKFLIAIVALIWAISMAIIGFYPTDWIIVIFGFIASSSIGLLIPVTYTYTAENFPTLFRATGVAITDGIGHLGGALCGQIILYAQLLFPQQDKFSISFSVIAASGILTAMLVCLGDKFTNRSLSEAVLKHLEADKHKNHGEHESRK